MKTILTTLLLNFAFCILTCNAANRFWVAGSTADWNNTANWSTTSGGSGGASVPGSSDVAKFDGSGTGNCTVNATVNVAGIDIASGYTGTISQGSYGITVGSSNYIQAGGTFSGGSPTIDINGNFNLSAGVFTATSGDCFIGCGNIGASTFFTHSGGTFNHNNGRVIFDPNDNYPTTVDVITSTLFYNVKISTTGSSQVLYAASNDTVKISNNLEHNSGILYAGCWSFQGNLTIGSNATGGMAQMIFTGTNNQTYAYGSSGRACRLTINKPSGTVSTASGTTDLAAQCFSLLAGTFTAPSGVFYIGLGEFSPATVFNHSGGTFNHNSALVHFNPGNNYTSTVDVISSTLFYNIKLNTAGSSQVINTATNDTVKVDNNLEYNSGNLSAGCWNFSGNLTIGSNATGGMAQMIFTGTSNQTYTYGAAGRVCNVTVNKSSGSVSAASGTTDLAIQCFKLVSGTFTAPTGNFFAGGYMGPRTVFEQTGGTFNANNGTMVFDTYGGGYTYTVKPHSSTLFYKVTAKSGGFLSLNSSTDTLKAENDLKLEQGYFYSGVLAAKTKVTVNSGWTGGTSQLLFTGNSDQDFDLSSASDKYDGKIKIKKPGGKVNMLSACVLDAASQTLTFVKGTMGTSATNLLTLGDNVTVSGMSDSGYVAGPMKKVGNDAFTFPTGKNGHYRKIGISAPGSTSDAYTAEYFEQNSNDTYSHSAKDGSIAELSRNEYWNLARTTGTSNVSVTLSWDTLLTSCSFADKADLKVSVWDGSTWKDKGNGGTTGTLASGTVVSSSASGVFGAYAVGTSGTFTCNKFDFCGEFMEPEYLIEPEEADTLLGLKVFDRFGNEYRATDLMQDVSSGDYSCQAGYFTLDFINTDPSVVVNPYGYSDLTNGAMYRDLTCRVFEDISQMLDHGPQDGRVRIRVLNATPGSQFAAAASSFYRAPYFNAAEGVIETDVSKTIKTQQNVFLYTIGVNAYHAQMEVNFGVSDPWYWVNSGAAMQPYELDAYTAMLHEALHMLGIASLIDSDGSSRAFGTIEFYSLWDLGLEVSNTDIINYTPPYSTSYSSVTLSHDCSPTTIYFDDVNCINDPVFSPQTWSDNSLSHFNCRPDGAGCPPYNTYVIKDCISQGDAFVNRHPNQQEYFAICDLGYQLTTTYGVTSMIPNSDDVYTLYDSYEECEENECLVSGADDLYFMPFDLPTLDLSGALNNDFTSGGTLSFFDNSMFTSFGDLSGTITQSGSSATYTPSTGFAGHTIINYVPECEDGSVGTMAFIHIHVEPQPLPPCEENPCITNLICHGDFEILEDDFTLPLSYVRLGGSNSPDLYPVRQTQMSVAWVTQNCSNTTSLPTPINPPNPNNKYIGMGGFMNNRELIYFELQQPLILGTTYDFSFNYNARCNTTLRVILSEDEPCHINAIEEDIPVNCIEGGSYEPLQVEEFALGSSTDIGPYSIWSSESVQITPDFGNMKYLIITQAQCPGFGNNCYTLFDNFELTTTETFELEVSSTVTNETPCIGGSTQINYSVCNNTAETSPETTLHINIANGLTIVPNDFFDENGDVQIPELEPSECLDDILLDLQISNDNLYADVDLDAVLVSLSGACINALANVNTITPVSNYLTIEKTVTNGSSFQSGAMVNYEVEVCNIATDPLLTITDIEITDVLPEGFISGSVISSDFTDDNSTLTATIASLAPGVCETLSFSVQVMSAGASQCDAITMIENCAQLTSAEGGCALGEGCVSIEATSANIVDADYIGTDILGSLIVSGDVIAQQAFSIDGTLTISASLTLDGCDILMQPEAIIVVETGQTLTITGTHIYGCEEMWDQIRVEDGANVIVDGGSLLEDAEAALHLLGDATLDIDDAFFNKNYRGIYIEHTTGTNPFDPGPIINSHFICQVAPGNATNATLLSPYAGERSFRGVDIEGDVTMDVGVAGDGNEFRNGEAGIYSHHGTQINAIDNNFTNMWAGIVLNQIFGQYMNPNHRTTVVNNDFMECVTGVWFFGNTDARLEVSKTNEFIDCYIGIWSWINNRCHVKVHGMNTFTNSGSSPFDNEGYGILGTNWFNINDESFFQIFDNNTFTNLRFGIHLTNTYGTYIANNTITLNDYPYIEGTSWVEPACGIWLGYNMYSFVHDNVITGPYDEESSWEYWRSGIRSDMVPFNHVYCNSTENIDIGLDVVGPQPYTSFNANTMQGYHHAGININGFEEPWGSSVDEDVPDNRWIDDGDIAPWDNFIFHTYAATDLSGVEFNLRDDAPSEYYPGDPTLGGYMINDGGDPGFVISPFPITPNHGVISCEAYPYYMIRPVEEAKALVQDESTTAYAKLNKYMTYLLLKQDTLLYADSLIAEDIVLDSLYQNDSLLLAFKDSMETTTIGQIDAVLDEIELNMTKGAAGSAGLLITELNGIIPADSIEYFMKKMGLLALNRAAINNTSYTETEIDELRELAQKCPFIFGPGVFMARLTLMQIDSLPVLYQSECEAYYSMESSGKWDGEEPNIQNNNNPTQGDPEFMLYPNPNNGNMYVEYRNLTEAARFELYDMTGRKISTYNLNSEYGKLNISEPELSSGMYMYRIINDSYKYKFGKIVIRK